MPPTEAEHVKMRLGRRSNITACIRCRRKKKRCDQELPKCGLCEDAGAECVSYDAASQRQMPRSYVRNLEKRVSDLESKLRDLGIENLDVEEEPRSTGFEVMHSPSPERTSGGFARRDLSRDAAAGAGNPLNGSSSLLRRESFGEPAFNKIVLTDLMRAKPTAHRAEDPGRDHMHVERNFSTDEFDTSPISLPTRKGAQSLINAYFHFADQSLSLLHKPTLEQKVELLYTTPRVADLTEASTDFKMAVFFVFEAFAVALLTLQKYDPLKIPTSLAERYHNTALKTINEVGLPSDLEGVQALLLIAQYYYHHPTVWAVWKTVGSALHLAVELGLHQDPPAGERLDAVMLDNLRRTFWVGYTMDRSISMTLGLPTLLSDGAITAKFPSEEPDENITVNGITIGNIAIPKPKRLGLHLLRYRQLQSEMRMVLYEKSPAASAYIPVDLDKWQHQMHERIKSWYADTPSRQSLTHREERYIENLEVTYYAALFYLYRPSPNVPNPSKELLMALADATMNMIRLYRLFFTKKQLTIYWLAVDNLFSAGTALIYAYVNSTLVQERITLRNLESMMHTCSSVLWGMVEHFPNFGDKRDRFDALASKTLKDLGTAHSEYAATGLSSTPILGPQGQQPPVFEANGADQAPHPAYTITSADDQNLSQYAQLPPLMAGVEPGTNVAHMPFSFSDFDGISFNWETLENTIDFCTPSWL
ncbi:fungal-specific transcription factor domain-containing protein [Exophiala viscosa]|uniref:fungal-specific transcription factor domain-containing protein n=1 Tax=Exophiala viscosa TaxID=2486360 RepID=UPI00218CE0CF|nr:fungal-specific transcription factor domain-containing protein [Exophiala viscosa]